MDGAFMLERFPRSGLNKDFKSTELIKGCLALYDARLAHFW